MELLLKLLALFRDCSPQEQAMLRPTLTRVFEEVTYPKGKLTGEEIRLGREQGKIACIKAYKNRTGAGLKEAKDTCETEFYTLGVCFFGHDIYGNPIQR